MLRQHLLFVPKSQTCLLFLHQRLCSASDVHNYDSSIHWHVLFG